MIRPKILIVDDDEEICEEMASILQGEGYFVNKAFDGLQAKNALERDNYNLLLLDLKIGGLSGFDILKIVKERYPKAKVLVISARPMREHPRHAILTDEEKQEEKILKLADGYVNKPFDVEVLLDIIHELIS